jgi:hypothetical protein
MTERRLGIWTILDMPVLMVDPVVLSNVGPHQPERALLAHPINRSLFLTGWLASGPTAVSDRGAGLRMNALTWAIV